MSERLEAGAAAADSELRSEWIVRAALWLVSAWRPHLGWLALALCMALSMLPALLLQENGWLRAPVIELRLVGLGPLAVATAWLLASWRRPWPAGRRAARLVWLGRVLRLLLFLLLGAAVLLQLLGDWLPGWGDWWLALTTGAWPALWQHILDSWQAVASRYLLWWQGVQQNNAARDDLILAGIAGALVWLTAGAMVTLLRWRRQGLLASVPILWPVGFIMLYSPADRWLFVSGVALALFLHLLLDQQALVQRWQAAQLDYSPSLLIERGLTALSGFALALVVATLMPNLYVYDITAGYYAWLQPVNQRMEATAKRLFPGLAGVMPWQTRGVGGGLPNAFLLGAGSDLGRREVMRVRTNEPVYGYEQPPLGHPLRGATFADYDGLGWDNRQKLLLTSHEADQPWTEMEVARRPLLQSVNLDFTASVIYAAGEPQSASIDYVAQERFAGELVALAARTRSYTVVSQTPALSRAELEALPSWGEGHPLPPEYALFLALPDTVTERTRQLAAQLTANQPNLYAKAGAIEDYLRQIPYDLEIGAPPPEVTDVADYFLFDLRRGYCDYYATAFVVLARISGLPTRFASGFAPGSWLMSEQQWVVTEADAHSWPEVYFPEVGWVRFEPTAYRPQPPRIGLPEQIALGAAGPAFEPLPAPAPLRVWLPLWWLVLALGPLLAAVWAVLYWRGRREDPWLGLLRWGQRAGHPLGQGETALEYGQSLADYVQEKHSRAQDLSRTAAHEVRSLSQEVSAVHYAPPEERPSLRRQAGERWTRLRHYLRSLR